MHLYIIYNKVYNYCSIEFICSANMSFVLVETITVFFFFFCSCILHTLYNCVKKNIIIHILDVGDENPFFRTPPSSLGEPIKVREIYVAHWDINTRVQSMQIGSWRKHQALWRLSLQLGRKQHSEQEELSKKMPQMDWQCIKGQVDE